MTYQELAAEIMRLSLPERLSLLELVSRSLRDDLRPRTAADSLAVRLRGIARPDGPAPTDAEIGEGYTAYLEHKYS